MGSKTALYDQHVKSDARMVDFGGWDMPLHYGSQIQEHHAVRQKAGMFDVGHMMITDLHGRDARTLLRTLLANDVAQLDERPGQGLYSLMLNEKGGVIDDLIVYFVHEQFYRVVSNCGTRKRVAAWIKEHSADMDVRISERRDLGMIAVQGPESLSILSGMRPEFAQILGALKSFGFSYHDALFIARTGYTGEKGVEIILPNTKVDELWQQLAEAGVQPCGLGARDTLRLEAGLNLYGHEMDETTLPFEANLAWTLAWEPASRDFIGRKSLEKQKTKSKFKLVGLILLDRGVLRAEQPLLQKDQAAKGVLTSGGFSPTLERSIGLARVPIEWADSCLVEIRGKQLRAKIVSPCFVRQGKIQMELPIQTQPS